MIALHTIAGFARLVASTLPAGALRSPLATKGRRAGADAAETFLSSLGGAEGLIPGGLPARAWAGLLPGRDDRRALDALTAGYLRERARAGVDPG